MRTSSEEQLFMLRQENARLHKQLEVAREALFQCYMISGADTDGARKLSDMGRIDPPIEVLAVCSVQELRRDYDEDSSPAPGSDS